MRRLFGNYRWLQLTHATMWTRAMVFGVAALACCLAIAADMLSAREQVIEALQLIGRDEAALTVARGARPNWRAGRLEIVDESMADPLTMQALSRRLLDQQYKSSFSAYLAGLLRLAGIETDGLVAAGEKPRVAGHASTQPVMEQQLGGAVGALLSALTRAQQLHRENGGAPSADELSRISDHLGTSISHAGDNAQVHWMTRDVYHRIGARIDTPALAAGLLTLLESIERVLPALENSRPPVMPLAWDTPDGRVLIAGRGNDRHTGDYLLLIDLGGDDQYENVGHAPEYGRVSVVIDLGGDDSVRWDRVPGPGAGILGMGIWVDLAGDDSYTGRNLGVGSAVLGAGLHLDVAGNDRYRGNAIVQGAGQYGIGILLDGQGNDTYTAALSSQGFAGPAGLGLQIDLDGNDDYRCNGRYPDVFRKRVARSDGQHFVSMCQGYSFGVRPRVSGGLGLLLDRRGSDTYRADLFAQGASLWFGLGMLADGGGNDHYRAHEHAQGESLHLGTGFLGDWGGNDRYEGYERCQGVGLDRAAGFLYDHAGDDEYVAHHDAQGTGLKPFGVGLLVDAAGNDRYSATASSQGYSARPESRFPDRQWPTGVLIDVGGKDVFELPGVAAPDAGGRIRNRQGVALNR